MSEERPPGASGRLEDFSGPEWPRPDTGPIRTELHRAHTQAPSAHDIAASLAGIMTGMVDAPPNAIKKINARNWLVNLIIACTVAASGAVAAYKATEDRSKSNANGVATNADRILDIRSELASLRQATDGIATTVGEIRTDVQDLQTAGQAAETARLRDRAHELERELQRLRRGRAR